MARRPRTVGDVGERGLIAHIQATAARSRLGDVGQIGDDAAVLSPAGGASGSGRAAVVSTDLLVEGTHWRDRHLKAAQLGWRALVANLSDIAAMGAKPAWFTLGLAMPPSQPLDWFRGLMKGLSDAADVFECPLIGGDLVRSPVPTIAITVGGLCRGRGPIRRSAAQAGQTIFVTGDLGRAALALRILDGQWPARLPPLIRRTIVERHIRPIPRIREGALLGQLRGLGAMMDVSDGLVSDLQRICEQSGVGAEIDLDALPVHPSVRGACAKAGLDARLVAAASGEEFELLFTSPLPESWLRTVLPQDLGVKAIGQITPGREIRWFSRGDTVDLDPKAVYDHFSQGGGPARR